jgi:hypothetical protein
LFGVRVGLNDDAGTTGGFTENNDFRGSVAFFVSSEFNGFYVRSSMIAQFGSAVFL